MKKNTKVKKIITKKEKKNQKSLFSSSKKNFFKTKKKKKTSLENFLDNSIEWPKSLPNKMQKEPILSDKNANFKIPSTISSVKDSFDLKRISIDSLDFHRERIIKKFK